MEPMEVDTNTNTNTNTNKYITIEIYDENEKPLQFIIPGEMRTHMKTLDALLEDVEDDSDMATPMVHESLTPEVMDFIVKYCQEFIKPDNPKIDYDDKKQDKLDNIPEWETKLFEPLDIVLLYGLLNAANYLNFRPLLVIGCKIIATRVKGHTTDEMREILRLPDDLSPEEKADIEKKQEWFKEDSNSEN